MKFSGKAMLGLVLALVPLICLGQDSVPEKPAMQPGVTVEQGRTAQPDDSSQPGTHVKIEWPDLKIDGGTFKMDIVPGKHFWPSLKDVGFWAGPELGLFFPDLEHQFHPLLAEIGIPHDFVSQLTMLGVGAEVTFGQNFAVGGWWRNGYYQKEDRVGGEKRSAAMNLSMGGMSAQVQYPVMKQSSWDDLNRRLNLGDEPLISGGAPMVAAGSRFGVGALTLYQEPGDLFDDWAGTEMMVSVEPYAGILIPFHKYARMEILGGYNFLQFFTGTENLTRHGRHMIEGDNLGGWSIAANLKFGAHKKK